MSKNIDSIYFHNAREIHDLKQMLDDSCRIYAQRPAFWVKKYKGGEFLPISYKLVKHDVDALGTKLIDMGLKGKNIAILGMGCYEWIISYLAVVNGTGIAVPIDKELEPEAIQNLLNRADCDMIFYSSSEANKIGQINGIQYKIEMEFYGDRSDFDEPLVFPSAREGVISWKQLVTDGEKLLQSGNRDFIDAEIDRSALAVLLFTSGTTGIPKGVMLSHHNIAANIMDVWRYSGIQPNDKNLSVLPIHHTYACTCNLAFLYSGASTVHFEGLKYILQNLKETQATYFVVVPLIAEMIYGKIWKEVRKTGKEKLLRRAIAANKKTKALGLDASKILFRSVTAHLGGKLKTIISGASSISPTIIRGFEDLGITILQAYGLTETAPFITVTPKLSKDRYRKAGSTGLPVGSGDIRIANANEDGIGEVWYRGPNVMLGYYKMPNETDSVMSDDWFNTGDLGFLDPDGWLYLTGRKKNVIVTKNGENIYPEEIEAVVNNHPYVSDCMVYSSGGNGNDVVTIQIIPNMENISHELGAEPNAEELQNLMKSLIGDINEKMPNYKRIRSIILRKEDFVRTTTKKIIRKENI